MSILDQAKEHFSGQLQEKKSIEVPEWGMTIYFRTTDSALQKDKYSNLIQQEKIEGFAELLLVRALDEHGRKKFKPKDKEILMNHVDPQVMLDIGLKILGADEDVESEVAKEASKN